MKTRIVFSLAILMLISVFSFAQNEEDDSYMKKDLIVRSDRQIAISAESGWRTLSGVGVNVTYYTSPKLGLDLGAGLSYMGLKAGARARILFSERNFSPYVGLGVNFANGFLEDQVIEDPETFVEYYYDTKSSLFGQVLFGLEYISNGGFYIGWNIGYAPRLKKNVVFDSTPSEVVELTVNLLYGGSISTALNIGYAF